MKLLVLLLIGGIITSGISFNGSAFAQEVTIVTSADDHGGRFFGEGIVRIVITDSNSDDDSTVEEIQVSIRAEPDSGSATMESFTVPETSESSGRFELFLMHANAMQIGPEDLDPTNSMGVEGDGMCIEDCAPFITFGSGGNIDIQSDLYEEVEFEIITGNIKAKVSYEETIAVLKLDRDSYGTTSFVYVSVLDQDANRNPTAHDQFTIDPDSNPNNDLLTLIGGNFDDAVIFKETGDNTAVFEGRYKLGESIIANSELLSLTLFDKANYGATLAAPENNSNNIDEISFIVGNTGGTLDIESGHQFVTSDPLMKADKDSYTLGDNVRITIVDQDANANSETIDSVQVRISSGDIDIELAASETDVDTGIFEVNFLLAEETNSTAGTFQSNGSITIVYTDEQPADYYEKLQAGVNPEKGFTLKVDLQIPDRTGIEAIDVTAPIGKNMEGGSGQYQVGSSITLTTTLVNNNHKPQPFVALIEVRNTNGVTVFLALQGGMLEPTGVADIGVLWQPDQSGLFEVRTFVFSDIIAGEVLSTVASSEIMVT